MNFFLLLHLTAFSIADLICSDTISHLPDAWEEYFCSCASDIHGYYAECGWSCERKAHECKKTTTSASLTRFIRRTNQRSTSCVRKAKFISHRLPIFEFFRGDVFCNLREKQAKQDVIHNKIILALLRTILFNTGTQDEIHIQQRKQAFSAAKNSQNIRVWKKEKMTNDLLPSK